MICHAQFPAPHSFWVPFSRYILLDDWGICGEKEVDGPTYCTSFQWEAPDLSETEAQLTGYNIYQYYSDEGYIEMEIPFSEAKIIAQTTDTYLQMEGTDRGITWVTAVYSDPEGESAPSNILFNFDPLPIAIKKVERQSFSLTHNKQKNGIEVNGIENIVSLSILRLDGTAIIPVSTSDFHFIDTKNIEKGVYIVKITTKDAKAITEKMVIK